MITFSGCGSYKPIVMSVTISAQKTMFGSSLPPVVCRMAHVLFTLFMFVYLQWCPTHIVLCFCFVFLRLLYPMFPVSLDCPFVIATSVFSNVYLWKMVKQDNNNRTLSQIIEDTKRIIRRRKSEYTMVKGKRGKKGNFQVQVRV